MDDAQTIIARVGATIASSLTIDEVLSAIARQVCEAFGVASADIHRYSADTDLLHYVASWGVAEGFTKEGAGVGETYPPEMRLNYVPVVRERRIVEVHRDDPGLPIAEAAEMDRWGEKSNLDGPLEFGGQAIAVLGIVESHYCRLFTEDEKLLFSQLAVLAAIAIHNADVFSVLEHLVITDGLTDLFNHRHFYDRLGQEVARAERYGLPLSLLDDRHRRFQALQRPVRASRRRRRAARDGRATQRADPSTDRRRGALRRRGVRRHPAEHRHAGRRGGRRTPAAHGRRK